MIVYVFTSSSYTLGAHADAALKARLEESAHGVPVVIARPAARLAVRAIGACRIALIHRAWFSADLDRLGAAYFTNQCFDVVRHGPAPVRSDDGEVHPAQLYEWARTHVPLSAEAVLETDQQSQSDDAWAIQTALWIRMAMS